MNMLYVFLGGGIGAVFRFLIQLIIGKHQGVGFPFSTFVINTFGCLFIGLLAAYALKFRWNEAMTLFIFTGILGGFTTFSSFSIEFVQLIKNNETNMAFLYVGLSNFAGLSLCALGFYMAK